MDIEKDDIDYDLHIDAYSGEVYSVDRDDDGDDDDNFSNYKNVISQDDAIAIAEKAANGKVVEIELDEDDGLLKYEVELRTDRGEAEVEIDASTGNVLEVELDKIRRNKTRASYETKALVLFYFSTLSS